MKSSKYHLLRSFTFLLALLLCFLCIGDVFKVSTTRPYESTRVFLQEKRDSLDAVYIGSSNVHAFWQPCFGWEEYGIASWNYSIDSLSARAIKYLLIEARKTQPEALYIINLNSFSKESLTPTMQEIHKMTDYFPFSRNKFRLINALTEGTEYTGLKKMEFYFPVIRFHSRWDELDTWSFSKFTNGFKSSICYPPFNNRVQDLSGQFSDVDSGRALSVEAEDTLSDLISYCDERNIHVLFVVVPQALSEEELERINTAEDLVRERGYPCVNIMKKMGQIGISPQTDFYNENHTNVHGSLKFSHYLGQYLSEQYHFSDKRGAAGWADWDEAARQYREYLSPFALPFEFEHAQRDDQLSSPSLCLVGEGEPNVTITWDSIKGAEGYEVYRQLKTSDDEKTTWERLADLDAEVNQYFDPDPVPECSNIYTVVPYRVENGVKVFGSFPCVGISTADAVRSA